MSETTKTAPEATVDTQELIDGAQIIPQTERAAATPVATTPAEAAPAPTEVEQEKPEQEPVEDNPTDTAPDAQINGAYIIPPTARAEAATPSDTATPAAEEAAPAEAKAPEPSASQTEPEESKSAAKPRPVPRPIPRPRPMPGQQAVPSAAVVDDDAVRRAAAWGRVDEDGNVYLRSADGERLIGQYAAGGSHDDALALYARRYVDLASQVSFLEARIEKISPEEAGQSIKSLEQQLKEPAVIGDVEALRTQVATMKTRVAERREQIQAERRQAKEQAIAERTKLVERAEAIAGKDPSKIHWRNSGNEFTEIFESWKTAQRSGPRIDRPTEEELWHRFSRARSQFDRMRRQHFSQLETQRAEVEARKKALIARAEALQDSTEWTATASQFRALMDEWRKAGRASRRTDDKLWNQFHAAQQKFFDARSAHFQAKDEEQGANLKAKLELVAEAEKLLPITDIEAAKEALRSIQDRWEEIGMVPRQDISRTEGRLRKVEDAVREAENDRWRATDPQKKQRSDGMAAQLEKLIGDLDAEIAAAEAEGDDAKVASLKEDRAARQAWLDQVLKDL